MERDNVTTRPKAKHWCFTVNNYNEETIIPDRSEYEYMVIGKEVGESGTPHLQGYVVMKKQCLLSTMKKLIPGAHLEVARGTPKAASDYCKKMVNLWKREFFHLLVEQLPKQIGI